MKTNLEIIEWVKKEIECCHNLSLELPDHAASRYEAVMLALENLLSWITQENNLDGLADD